MTQRDRVNSCACSGTEVAGNITRTYMGSVMKRSDNLSVADPDDRRGPSLYGVSVEYGLHTVLWLLPDQPGRASGRDLADMQGVPAAMLAKILPRLEKAGIVSAHEGISGGYELAKPATEVTVLDVIDAIESDRKLFDCKEIRRGCVLFDGSPPDWAVSGVCRIHAVMIRAEKQMRAELARTTLADLAKGGRPAAFEKSVGDWFENRAAAREEARMTAVKKGRRSTS